MDFVDRVFITGHRAVEEASSALSSAVSTVKTSSSDVSGWAVDTLKKTAPRLKGAPPPPPEPVSVYDKAVDMLRAHRWLAVSTGLAAIGGGAYYLKHRQVRKVKRRANRLGNGARFEVILVIGSPLSPFIQRLTRDLNTRGFIVYVTTSSEEELKVIENEDSPDIRSLAVNYENNKTVKESVRRLDNILVSPVLPFQGAANEHYLTLKAVIVAPDWTRLPRVSNFEQLNMMELKRVFDDKCLGIVGILNNGLLDVIRENNERAATVEEVNGISSVGHTKVLFLDIVPTRAHGNDNGCVQKLALQLNSTLYQQLKPCFAQGWFQISSPQLLKLTAKYSFSSKEDHQEYVSPDSGYSYIMHSVEDLAFSWTLSAPKNKKISSTKLHYRVFDIINSQDWQFGEQTIYI